VSLDGGVTDTRACTACTCGDPSGAACGGTTTLHAFAGCSDVDATDGGIAGPSAGPATLAADGTCHTGLVTIASTYASAENPSSVTSQGTCAPAGGKLTGTATVTAQTQICCQN
jgi:hypothetical protein